MSPLLNGTQCTFQSIVDAFWWTIVTITTIGYGDVIIQTYWAKIIASFTMITGILLVGFPVSIFTANFSEIYQEHKLEQELILIRKKKLALNDSGRTSSKVSEILNVIKTSVMKKRRSSVSAAPSPTALNGPDIVHIMDSGTAETSKKNSLLAQPLAASFRASEAKSGDKTHMNVIMEEQATKGLGEISPSESPFTSPVARRCSSSAHGHGEDSEFLKLIYLLMNQYGKDMQDMQNKMNRLEMKRNELTNVIGDLLHNKMN
jgi:hypothetical protein